MLSSLPDRPLYEPETDALSGDGPIELVVPASPDSIQQEETGRQQIHDLLVFMGETVAAIAYVAEDGGWRLVAKERDEEDTAYERAYDQLLEYRGYDNVDREEALKQAIMALSGLPEDAIEANPEELASLGEE